MAKFIYKKENIFIGSDGTINLIIGPRKQPIFEQHNIIPGETIIESDIKKVISVLERDNKYEKVI